MSKTIELKVTGLDCPNCAQSVEKGIAQLEGVQSCALNFATTNLRVTGAVSPEAVIERVRALGHDVVAGPSSAESGLAGSPPSSFLHYLWQRREGRLTLLGALLILPGLFLAELAQLEHWLIDLTSVGALMIAGGPVAASAWRSLRLSREVTINGLMAIAAVGAVIIGAYTEAGMVMVLFALGESLEGYTANRARDSIRSLLEVAPNEATRLWRQDGQAREERVKVAELQLGDLIVVKPGERIPMDGVVRAGLSSVNQAPITGESQLVEKTAGAPVFASTVNGEGVLEIEVTHRAGDNTISRLIKMVEEAQERRAPSQRFIDQFAKYYTPAVIALAALVATVPPLLLEQPFWNPDENTFGWLYRGLALLVVACPCALVISTPVSIISAISSAARQGVLIKGGAYLETLSRIKAMAFDKTGTLTTGRPSVVALRSVNCQMTTELNDLCPPCGDVLALAFALERRSEHPLAHAIVAEAKKWGVQERYAAGEQVQALVGKGITGQVNGQQVLIGSHTYFDQAVPHSDQVCQAALVDAQNGYTSLMVEAGGRYLGTITVADTVRESSREALAQLRQAGVQHLIMLSGDHRTAARTIAAKVGVTDIRAELLPEHKVEAVQALQKQYGPVAMVGDGINDAPALAMAEVGIAVGGATSQAMETADITLLGDDLRQLPFVYRLSRATMRTIGWNVGLSIAIKAGFMVLVLLGLSTMWLAVAADMGTSLLVTLNGMRLLHYRAEGQS
jgi:Cd2+/Zn2+-exporting ATPase